MKKLGLWLAYISIALAIGFSLWAMYLGVQLFVSSSPTAKIGVITAIVSVATFLYNNNRQQTREINARQFADKRIAYQRFFDLMFDMVAANKRAEEIPESQLIDKFQQVTKELMVWGSPQTTNQYNSFMRSADKNTAGDALETFRNVESLLRAFRKDLGHNDRMLERLGLSKLILKADEHEKIDAQLSQSANRRV